MVALARADSLEGTVAILDKLTDMDASHLRQLEQNARGALHGGSEKRQAEADAVLHAIAQERGRREQQEAESRSAAKKSIRQKVRDLGLFDRVVLAFEALPPAEWESEALNAIALHPGRDFNFLAQAVGKRDGGYINLAVGSLCSAREHFLRTAPPSTTRKGEKLYSALLIDFAKHVEPDGSQWHGWILKPEAEAALRHLGILSAPAECSREQSPALGT